MSQFNFSLDHRAAKKGQRSVALSRRQQDIPNLLEDPRLKEREFMLIDNNLWARTNKNMISSLDSIIANKIPIGASLFEDEEMQNLWNKGVERDQDFHRLFINVARQNIFPRRSRAQKISFGM